MSEFVHPATGPAPQAADALRVVSAEVAFEVLEPADMVLQVVASTSSGRVRTERLDIRVDGQSGPEPVELAGPYGARIQVLRAPAGHLTVHYRSEIDAAGEPSHSAADGHELSRLAFLRPSRYCPSDHLAGFAVAEFGTGSTVWEHTAAVTGWIRERIGYVAGSSSVHDSAEDTLLTGVGTCRDFAHLGVALCRALGIPARFAAVYAPGLWPMDFHAVFETLEEDGRWSVHDATDLAPRQSMVRIVTGRDAADAAFSSVNRGIATLEQVEVTATSTGALPVDDHAARVELA